MTFRVWCLYSYFVDALWSQFIWLYLTVCIKKFLLHLIGMYSYRMTYKKQNTTKIFACRSWILKYSPFHAVSVSAHCPLRKAEELKRAATAWVMAARERQPWTKAAVTRAFPTQTTSSRGRNMKLLVPVILLFFYKKKHYSANFKVGRGSKGLDEILFSWLMP